MPTEHSSLINIRYPGAKIDANNFEIRVLWVLPGLHTDIVSCQVQVISLMDDVPPYIALSYVWGDQSCLRRIILNNAEFFVTQQLEAALRHFRLAVNARCFWIDQLCINQNSADEKNQQVNFMKQIFMSATEVFVWLDQALQTCRTCDEAERRRVKYLVEEPLPTISAHDAVNFVDMIERLNPADGVDHTDGNITEIPLRDLLAFDKILRCTWWRRIWTVQETIVNPNVSFVLGRMIVSWDDLVSAIQLYLVHLLHNCCSDHHIRTRRYLRALHQTMMDIMQIHYLRCAWQKHKHLDLSQVLQRFRSRQATDPRDKIFGLLGLVSARRSADGVRVRANYNSSMEVIYVSIAKAFLQNERSFDFLMSRQAELSCNPALPSWAVDWSASVHTQRDQIYRDVQLAAPLYRVTLDQRKSIEFSPVNPGLMRVRGLLIDEVSHVIRLPTDFRGGSTSTVPHLNHLSQKFDHILDNTGPRAASTANPEHLFWRLLCMDLMVTSSLSDSQDVARVSRAEPARYRSTTREATIRMFEMEEHPVPFLAQPLAAWQAFALFATNARQFGMGPLKISKRDRICVFLGASMPWIIRPIKTYIGVGGEEKHYQLVGYCYFDGIMDGELLHGRDDAEIARHTQWINII